MSWHYLQAQGGVFSEADYLAGLRLQRLKSSSTPVRCFSPVSETDSCPSSPSGMMSGVSTASRGAALSMSSAADSPAKTSRPPASEQELMASEAGCGVRCTELLAKYDRDMCLWKTPQLSLLAGLDEFSETWPKSGIMLHGCAYQQLIAVPRTSVNECGFSPQTPNNVDFFHTPTCNGLDGGSNSRKALRKRMQHLMPTPTACNAPNTGANTKGPKSLLEVARTGWNPGEPWPPRKTWLTPMALDGMRSNLKLESLKRHWEHHPNSNLAEQVAVEELAKNPLAGGQLNPDWEEWLMAWPIGWTALKPLETGRFQSWLLSLSDILRKFC